MCLPPKAMNNANETNSSIPGAKLAAHLYALLLKSVILSKRNSIWFNNMPLTSALPSLNMDVHHETALI